MNETEREAIQAIINAQINLNKALQHGFKLGIKLEVEAVKPPYVVGHCICEEVKVKFSF